jgi:uncharacterized protein (DUF1330 family)
MLAGASFVFVLKVGSCADMGLDKQKDPRVETPSPDKAELQTSKEKIMAAYLISIYRSVTDRRRLEDYWANAAPSFEGYGAKPLGAYTPFEVLEGGAVVKGIVLFEFPSIEIAKRWYTSPAYQQVRQRRLCSAEFELILVDGGWKPASERMPETMA